MRKSISKSTSTRVPMKPTIMKKVYLERLERQRKMKDKKTKENAKEQYSLNPIQFADPNIH